MKKEIRNNPKESLFDYWRGFNTEPLFEEYAELLHKHPLIAGLSMLHDSSILVFDHVNIRYAYVSENQEKISGYKPELFLQQNWDFSKKLIPRDNIDFAMNLSHKVSFEYLYQVPVGLRNNVIFTKDYPYITANRGLRHFIQKGIVLKMDEKGNIQLTLHIASDISHLKKDHNSNLIIAGPNGNNQIYSWESANQVLINHGSLSQREMEILDLLDLSQGSKEIASNLSISIHTVDTHRRNLLTKFNCVDTTALVTYCKMCSII